MTFTEKLIKAGHATKAQSRITCPVQRSGYYTAENGFNYFVSQVSPGKTRTAPLGYSAAYVSAAKSAPAATDDESQAAFERHMTRALGL